MGFRMGLSKAEWDLAFLRVDYEELRADYLYWKNDLKKRKKKLDECTKKMEDLLTIVRSENATSSSS